MPCPAFEFLERDSWLLSFENGSLHLHNYKCQHSVLNVQHNKSSCNFCAVRRLIRKRWRTICFLSCGSTGDLCYQAEIHESTNEAQQVATTSCLLGSSVRGASFSVSITYLWLARNEGMDPYSSPYITHHCSFHFLFHSCIPTLNPKIVVSMFFFIPSFLAKQR